MKNKEIRLVLVNLWQFPARTPHFGLISLAAYIRKNLPKIEIKIVESLDPYDEVVKNKPEIVGFTSDTLVFTKTMALARRLKLKLPVPFLLGGVHITAMPEELDPVFRLGIIGEGEETLLELLKIFCRGKRFSYKQIKKIKGVIFRYGGRLVLSGRRDLIKNIDVLPYPARDLVPMEKYYLKNQLNLFGVHRMAAVMSSRGCPYHCVFCGSPAQWGTVRFHSPEYVVGEILDLYRKYKIDGLMFWDDLFIAPFERLEKVARLILEQRLEKKIVFHGFARANLIDEKTCQILRKMNVKRLIFGLESGSERILKFLKNNSVTVRDNRKAIELCRKYGITTSSGLIVGTPGETVADLKRTLQFMTRHPLDNVHIYLLTPYPGTEIWQSAIKNNLVSAEMDFGQLFSQLPEMSPGDFIKKRKDVLTGRIFLNLKYRDNDKYLNQIFKLRKLAFFQNYRFYFKVIVTDPILVGRILKSAVGNLFHHG